MIQTASVGSFCEMIAKFMLRVDSSDIIEARKTRIPCWKLSSGLRSTGTLHWYYRHSSKSRQWYFLSATPTEQRRSFQLSIHISSSVNTVGEWTFVIRICRRCGLRVEDDIAIKDLVMELVSSKSDAILFALHLPA